MRLPALALLCAVAACQQPEPSGEMPPAASAIRLQSAVRAGGYQCGAALAPDPPAALDRLRADYRRWRERYVTRFGRSGLLRVKGGKEYRDGTPSEAIGYGMLLAVYMHDRPTFDGLWAYAKRFRNPNGLMAWSISPEGEVLDIHAATDGDEDMAFALLVAEDRWGGYADDAATLIRTLFRHAVEPGTYVFKPGDVVGGSGITNPSYFAPAYYKLFAAFTGEQRWMRVADVSYQILERVSDRHSRTTGLQPEWATARGDSVPDPYGYPFHFGYNATRTSWRLAADAAWNCDPRAERHLQKINSFFRRIGPRNIRDGYTLQGRPLGQYHNAAFVAPAAAAAVLAADPGYRRAMWDEAVGLDDSNYYNDSLRLLGLLFASGHMPPPEVDAPRTAGSVASSADA